MVLSTFLRRLLMTKVRPVAAVLLAVALFGAACGGDDEDTPSGQAPAAGEGGELRVGFTEDQYVVEGPRAGLGAYPLNANIVETLTYLSPDYQVQPRLAERWEFRAPNTWRFFLRQGVKFQDGQPFNAAAVKTGLFDRTAKVPQGGTIKAGPSSAVVVDDYTIDFTPTAPNFRVPEQLVHPNVAVYAPGSDPGKNPVGTGPFRFVSYRPKEQLVVEANPDYWGPKPKVRRITFGFYPDSEGRRLALERGDVDLAYQIPRPDVPSLRDRGFDIKNSTVGAYKALYANIHGSPPHDLLADPAVRKAVAQAIDRQAFVKGVLDGLATPDATMVPPSSLGNPRSRVTGVAHDPEAAKKLLDGAGWTPGPDGIRVKAGRRLKLTLVSGFPSAEAHRPTPTFLQAELRKIGVDVEIVERPDSASYQALIDNGQGDLYLEEGNQNDANPGFLPVLLFYGGGSGASAQYQKLFAPGPNFDQLLAPALSEPDLDKVRSSVAEAMHQIVDEQAVVIPLAGVYRIYGMKKSVQGFVPHPSFLNVDWSNVSLRS
jgi:peptide/nickel transport system substrate-binding protein